MRLLCLLVLLGVSTVATAQPEKPFFTLPSVTFFVQAGVGANVFFLPTPDGFERSWEAIGTVPLGAGLMLGGRHQLTALFFREGYFTPLLHDYSPDAGNALIAGFAAFGRRRLALNYGYRVPFRLLGNRFAVVPTAGLRYSQLYNITGDIPEQQYRFPGSTPPDTLRWRVASLGQDQRNALFLTLGAGLETPFVLKKLFLTLDFSYQFGLQTVAERAISYELSSEGVPYRQTVRYRLSHGQGAIGLRYYLLAGT